MVLFPIGQARGDKEAEGPDPEPVVVPNGPRTEPWREPVAMVGGKPKTWLEPLFVDIGENCSHTRDCPIPAKGNPTVDLEPPGGAQYPVLIRTVKTSTEPTATAGSKQLTVDPQPEYFMAV